MLSFLQDNLAIVTLLTLMLVVLIVLGLVFWAAVRPRDEAASTAAERPRLLSIDSLRQSFRRAVELIEANIVSRSERYGVPWVLVVNEGTGARTLPLVQAGLQSALSTDVTLTAAAQGISWNFFDRGIAIQIQGDSLGSPEGDEPDNRTWDEFLGLCRDYRPDRPFDAIVLNLPADLLLRDDPQSQLQIAAHARSIHRRLWLAQNRFALRFPISVVVSECERVPGFARLAAALPEAMRSSMLGWSTPFDLAAPYQSSWVDAAMDSVIQSLSDACAEMSALELPGNDSSAYFLLPARIERLRAGLQLFADELMKPSAYHEPFVLRGFYLTGDCSDESALLASGVDERIADDQRAAPGNVDLLLRPACLRDLFEEKIFAESGLVRPTAAQRLRRPVLSRTLRWGGLALAGGWVLGLAVAGVRLHGDADGVVQLMATLDRHARDAAEARAGGVASAADVQSRAAEALGLLTRIDIEALGSVFMPGSYALFDDLRERLGDRLEQRFAEHELAPIRRGLVAAVSDLTGVPMDPATDGLVKGAACSLPRGWEVPEDNPDSLPLAMENMPAFLALSRFLGDAERIDLALRAEARLSTGQGAPDPADMRLLVRAVLGVDLKANAERAAAMFRRFARGRAAPDAEGLRAALGCTFVEASAVLDRHLFEMNPLLAAERTTVAQLARLTGGARSTLDTESTIAAWQSLLDGFERIEDLALPGAGEWMRHDSFSPGQAWEAMMQRAQGITLLGAPAALEARRRAEESFGTFRAAWRRVLGLDLAGHDPGLVWDDKESRWALSDDRDALQEAFQTLMEQPFMTGPRRRSLPDLPLQSLLAWDRARLELAVGLESARGRIRTEILPAFPAALRTDVERLANAALAEAVLDRVADAVIAVDRSGTFLSPSGGDAERAALARIQALLADLGARGLADQLAAFVSRDALARLNALDESFVQAEFFLPRERDFRGWTGGRGPMLQAFAVADPLALASWVAEQSGRLDAMARSAEALLPALDIHQRGTFLARRWKAITTEMARYRARSPVSSLTALEQFVLVGASELDGANCLDKLGGQSSALRSGDVFAERLQQLQSGLVARCRELETTSRHELWTSAALGFNRELAGRAPFAPLVGTAGGRSGATRAAADAEEVLRVLRLFERGHKSLADPARAAGVSVAVRRFDEQIERVRQFMAPLAPGDDGVAPGYDLAIEFRANPAGELEGNKIIDWSFSAGGQSLRLRDPSRPLRWEPGMPVALTLRLARDGAMVPRADEQQPDLGVDDLVVTFRAIDPWALYSFIGRHRDAEAGPRADGRSSLLRFDFPVLTVNDNPKIAAVASVARVYIRVVVSAAGKRAPLAWPGPFPVSAPAWDAP